MASITIKNSFGFKELTLTTEFIRKENGGELNLTLTKGGRLLENGMLIGADELAKLRDFLNEHVITTDSPVEVVQWKKINTVR